VRYSKLTDAQKKAYLENSDRCPYCGNFNVESGPPVCDNDEVSVNRTCYGPDCAQEWVETYRLVDVEDGGQKCTVCGKPLQEGDEVEHGMYGLDHSKCVDEEN
jgi:hypothetical protein